MKYKKILLVEENLKSRRGHHFQFVSDIAAAARAANVTIDVACHGQAESSVINRFNCYPIFRTSRTDPSILSKIPILRNLRFLIHNTCFYLKLRRILHENSYDLIFLPTASHYHLWAMWALQILHPKNARRVCLFFVQQPTSWSYEDRKPVPDKIAPILKAQIRGFSKLIAKGRTRLAVETPCAKSEFEDLCALPVHLWPHPVQLPGKRDTLNSKSCITFVSFGFARHEKGSDLLVKALELCRNDPLFQQCRFVVQWGNDFKMPDGSLMTMPESLRDDSRIKVIDQALNEREYFDELFSVSALLLPYRKSSYYGRLSRVSIEGAAAGIPMIVTSGTHLEDVVENQGAGIIIEDETPEALVKGMREFLGNRDKLVSEAIKRVPRTRDYNSADNFLSLLTHELFDSKNV